MWIRCLEVGMLVLFAGIGLTALGIALGTVVGAFRKAKILRTSNPPAKVPDKSTWSDEQKARSATHWKGWRDRMEGFGKDINQIYNPTRRDTLEIVKESQNWARLGIQYAIIANGGALAAMPYLLAQSASNYRIALADAYWSALWFAMGIAAAAFTCLVAYLDFQVTAGSYWAALRLEWRQAQQRHFENEVDHEYELHAELQSTLQAVSVKTSIAGVVLGIIAWIALIVGAFRLIVSMST